MLIDFREREREEIGREKKSDVREKHQLVVSHTCPDRDQTYNLGMCPDRDLNLQPFGLWDDAPSN